MSLVEPSKLKVEELRRELRNRNLDSSGLKNILVERLEKALEEEKDPSRGVRKDSSPATTNQAEQTTTKRQGNENTLKDSKNCTEFSGQGDKSLEEIEEKLRKRAERFGVPYVPSKEILERKRLLRAQRFGQESVVSSHEEEEKKRKRAERFGISPREPTLKLSKQVDQINQTLSSVSNNL
eukprot:jgi/Galph1/5562/GphlegSOOS_G4209.1